MKVAVNYTSLKTELTRARKVGIPSEKNAPVRFDCISLKTRKIGKLPLLQIGGVGGSSGSSYATHIQSDPDQFEEDPDFVFVKNEVYALVGKFPCKKNDTVLLEADFARPIPVLVFSTEDGTVLLEFPLEPGSRIMYPITTVEGGMPGAEQVWGMDEEDSVYTVSSSELWATMSDAEWLVRGLKNVLKVAQSTHSKAAMPYNATVATIYLGSVSPDLAPFINYASGLCLRLLATDDLALSEVVVPLVRKGPGGDQGAMDQGYGVLQQDIDGYAGKDIPTLYLTPQTATLLTTLLDPAQAVSVRIEFGKTLSGDRVPKIMVLANGFSLIRVPIDMSGQFSSVATADAISRKLLDSAHIHEVRIAPSKEAVKAIASMSSLRGAKDKGLHFVWGEDCIIVESDPTQTGSMSTTIDTEETGHTDPLGDFYLEAERVKDVFSVLRGGELLRVYDRRFVEIVDVSGRTRHILQILG